MISEGCWLTYSGQLVAGGNNVQDLERILADAPMLQQKMKPRHLAMIAVGEHTYVMFLCPLMNALH